MSIAPARRAALKALKRVRERESYGAETLEAVLSGSNLSQADHALATRLVYGVLQAEGTLDEAIDRFASKASAIEPRVRDALRLAAYEILFARTPPRAAVHEGVEAAKAVRPKAAGLANAVLRRLSESADTFPWGDPDSDDAALARATAHPLWLVELLIRDLGREDAARVLRAANEPAPLYLWHNPFAGPFGEAFESLEKDGADPAVAEPPGCLLARVPSAAVRGRTLADGLCLVADASAQLAAGVMGPHPGKVVVDLTAGRGTKTAQLQAVSVAAGAPADLRALDVHGFKTDILAKRMTTLGVPGVSVVTGDASDVAAIPGIPGAGTADAVLLDAPCSGMGTLRRRSEKRWRLRPEDLEVLGKLQSRLLTQAASLVRVGGVVVYSTCSITKRENDEVIAGFLAGPEGACFRVGDLRASVPEQWHGWIRENGFFQSLPESGGPDGHFVARLERVL